MGNPAATTDNALTVAVSTGWTRFKLCLVCREPIPAPLPHISVHLMEAPAVRGEGTVSLATTEFHMIRTQLVEQGLVAWNDKVWTLTPRGKRVMAELTTVKKATPTTPTS